MVRLMSSPIRPSHQAAAAILNGGKARRMHGANKARMEVDGNRIADTQLSILRQYFDRIAMVVGHAEQAEGIAAEPIFDRIGGKGPIDGIASALHWSPEPWVLVLASDMPDIHPAMLEALLAAREDKHDIIAAHAMGRVQPLLALYHRRLLPVFDELLTKERQRISDLLLQPPSGVSVRLLSEQEVQRADPEMRSFRNVNRPTDL